MEMKGGNYSFFMHSGHFSFARNGQMHSEKRKRIHSIVYLHCQCWYCVCNRGGLGIASASCRYATSLQLSIYFVVLAVLESIRLSCLGSSCAGFSATA